MARAEEEISQDYVPRENYVVPPTSNFNMNFEPTRNRCSIDACGMCGNKLRKTREWPLCQLIVLCLDALPTHGTEHLKSLGAFLGPNIFTCLHNGITVDCARA